MQKRIHAAEQELAATSADAQAPHTAAESHINVAVTKAASGLAVTGTVTVLVEAVRA